MLARMMGLATCLLSMTSKVWITSNAYASGAAYFAIQSQFEYTITQEYGQNIDFGGAHFEVTLTGSCVQNCDADDEDTIQVFVFDLSLIHI